MLILFYVAVIVWFRPSCISCILFFFFFTFCIFGFYAFLSAVLLFMVASSTGLYLSGNREINIMMMIILSFSSNGNTVFRAAVCLSTDNNDTQ